MFTRIRISTAGLMVASLVGVGMIAFAQDDKRLDADKIAAVFGAKATTTEDGVVRIAWARSDVPVKVDGMPL